jgi:hypothetical protein
MIPVEGMGVSGNSSVIIPMKVYLELGTMIPIPIMQTGSMSLKLRNFSLGNSPVYCRKRGEDQNWRQSRRKSKRAYEKSALISEEVHPEDGG